MGHCQTVTGTETKMGCSGGIRRFQRLELVDIWRSLENDSSSGILMFVRDSERKAFFLLDGAIIHAHSNQPGEKFKDFLLSGTNIKEQELDKINQEKPDNVHLGAVLLEREMIFPLAMRDVLRRMITSIGASIFLWDEGEFYFNSDVYNPVIEEHAVVSMGAVVLEGIKLLGSKAPWLEDVAVQNGWLKAVRSRNIADLCFQLTDDEEIYLNRIKREVPVKEFIKANKKGEGRGRLLLMSLLKTGYMQLEDDEDLGGKSGKNWNAIGATMPQSGSSVSRTASVSKVIPEHVWDEADNVTGDLTYGEIVNAFRSNCPSVHRHIPNSDKPIWERKKEMDQRKKNHRDTKNYKVPPVIAQQTISGRKGKGKKEVEFVPLNHAASPHEQLDEIQRRGQQSAQSKLRDSLKKQKAEELFEKAAENYHEGRFFNVVKHLEEAIRLVSDEAKYYNLLGQTQAKNRHITWQKRAAVSFKKAIECDPWQPELFINLANLYQKQGMGSRAIKQYKLALMLDPRNQSAIEELDKLIVGL